MSILSSFVTRSIRSVFSSPPSSLLRRAFSTHPTASVERQWPLDPRGEQIKRAKARRLGINISHRKLNLVAKLIRRMSVPEARRQLSCLNKKAAPIINKTLHAAVVNARAFGLNEARLIVDEAYVGKGCYLRRIRPWHGKGRYGIEHKKYAHLTVIVRELDEELWEATILPKYIHRRRTTSIRLSDEHHPIHSSDKVSWVSDLDSSYRKTAQSVAAMRAALPQNS